MAGPKIDLLIQSTSGHWNHPFDADTTAQTVLAAAVDHFRLQTGPGISYQLLKGGSVLALGETLAQLGLRDHDVLTLQPHQAQDG